MKAHEVEKLFSVSTPALDPLGTRVVVSVTRPDLDADATVGQLWSVPLDGSAPSRISRGTLDESPSFSPDGSAIAFLRNSQLVVMDARGGEAVPLTERALGVTAFHWSPDSTRIAYISREPEPGRYGSVEGIAPAAEPGRRITSLNYKYNAVGYTNDRRAHVFVVPVPALDAEPAYTPAPRPDGSKAETPTVPESLQLTSGDFTDSHPRFVGERVAFLSARHDHRDRDLVNQLWTVGLAGGEPEPLTDLGVLAIESFEPAADGAIYLIAQDVGPDGLDFVGRNSAVYLLKGRVATRWTDPETIDATDASLIVTADGVLVTNRARGRGVLLEVRGVDDVVPLSSGDVEVQAAAASTDRVVLTYSSPGTFGDVAVLENGVLAPLTDFSAALRESGIVTPVELTVTAGDGYPVHGWVAQPAGEGPFPTLLMIHGGPYADFGVHVFDETQVYVDAGYAVVYCNPRGSAGYGQTHGRAIKGSMGSVDHTDVLEFLGGALQAYSGLDRTRLGILGGSYGGYLTAWIIGHDHRFKAAIVERGYLDPPAFIGSSDIGMYFPQQYHGSTTEELRAQSPQEFAHLVTTPTLVIHSELDLRCPLAQAETYFATLRLSGLDAELLVFPGENHELSRSGRPRHRLQRFEAILDWMGRHL